MEAIRKIRFLAHYLHLSGKRLILSILVRESIFSHNLIFVPVESSVCARFFLFSFPIPVRRRRKRRTPLLLLLRPIHLPESRVLHNKRKVCVVLAQGQALKQRGRRLLGQVACMAGSSVKMQPACDRADSLFHDRNATDTRGQEQQVQLRQKLRELPTLLRSGLTLRRKRSDGGGRVSERRRGPRAPKNLLVSVTGLGLSKPVGDLVPKEEPSFRVCVCGVGHFALCLFF